MFSTLVFIAVLSILIVVHEFGHFIFAKRAGVRVEKFSLGFGKKIFSWKKGDTEYIICAVPLGGYVKLAGDNLEEYKGKEDEYYHQSISKRFAIIFAGPLLNYLLGIVCFSLIFLIGFHRFSPVIGGVVPDSGALEAGLLPGDVISAVSGNKVEYWDDIQRQIQGSFQKEHVSLDIIRDGKPLSLTVNLKKRDVQDMLGQKQSVNQMGILPREPMVMVRYGPLGSIVKGFTKSVELSVLTCKALGMILTGKLSMRDSVTGPLGIFIITTKAADMGIVPLLHVVAALNISLCIFNLLPVPALDGSHILFLFIEKIRGRAFGKRAEEIVSQIGLSLIIVLAVLVFYNDLVRFGVVDKVSKIFTK